MNWKTLKKISHIFHAYNMKRSKEEIDSFLKQAQREYEFEDDISSISECQIDTYSHFIIISAYEKELRIFVRDTADIKEFYKLTYPRDCYITRSFIYKIIERPPNKFAYFLVLGNYNGDLIWYDIDLEKNEVKSSDEKDKECKGKIMGFPICFVPHDKGFFVFTSLGKIYIVNLEKYGKFSPTIIYSSDGYRFSEVFQVSKSIFYIHARTKSGSVILSSEVENRNVSVSTLYRPKEVITTMNVIGNTLFLGSVSGKVTLLDGNFWEEHDSLIEKGVPINCIHILNENQIMAFCHNKNAYSIYIDRKNEKIEQKVEALASLGSVVKISIIDKTLLFIICGNDFRSNDSTQGEKSIVKLYKL